MRIAHLILAHKGPAQLARLLTALAHPDVDCFVHIDQKTDPTPFKFMRGWPGVFFPPTSLSVTWGGYSLTKVVLECAREILAHAPDYAFINVLSAQDYPLRPAAEVLAFLRQHRGQSFIECEPAGSAWWQANQRRVTRYYLTDFQFSGRYAVQRALNTLLPARRFPLLGPLHGGPMGGWYTLSRAAAEYVVGFVDGHARLRRFARLTWGSDEFLVPTILLNSPLAASIHNDNLRYIDWSGGGFSPKTLTSGDFAALQASPKLWARKFDIDVDATILDQLDQTQQRLGPGQKVPYRSLVSLG
jgi:hypothetical protein